MSENQTSSTENVVGVTSLVLLASSIIETPYTKPEKPLGQRAYGSIPHLPGSRRGPADKGLSDQQAKLLTEKTRDRHDLITVQEKLDGSNVAVANIGGEIVALIRAGYRADGSDYEQHHHFARWVDGHRPRFAALLEPGERVSGEWLMEAHGTLYNLPHEPFVAFDIMTGNARAMATDVASRCAAVEIVTPRVIHVGGALSIADMLAMLEPSGHGALEDVEGAVWRMERKGVVDFLGKYVRPEKVDGKYLNGVGGIEREPIYNWHHSLANVKAHPRGQEEPGNQTGCLPASDEASCSASDLFSEDEIKSLRQAGSIGDMGAARKIVEGKGLTWMDSLVEKTQIQQHNV